MTQELPFVSVIVLNYNGAHYLPACLDAMRLQNYPQERYEVIVTDNGSTDDSLALLERQYPWVRLYQNGRNLGFSAANNAAIKNIARGEFFILLNNDTAPEPMWLEEMVKAALTDPKIAIVTGHLRLFYNQLELRFEAETIVPPNDPRQLGVQVFDLDSGAVRGVFQYLDGFYWREYHPSGRPFRWMKAQARLGVPVPWDGRDLTLKLRLSSGRSDGSPARVRAFLGDQPLAEWSVAAGEPGEYRLQVPASARSLATPLEQNTGSIVFRSGAGRDRGTFVHQSEVFFETQQGLYEQEEEVFAGCGAAMLFRRSALEDFGYLDDDFFMYYEDTDISWRAWLFGWKVVYAPQALVRHIHCGTNKEWSPDFIYKTERNRLVMVFKNGTASMVRRVWGGYFLKVLRMTWDTLVSLLRMRPGTRAQARWLMVYYNVLFTLIAWLPSLWGKRRAIQTNMRVPHRQLETWFKVE